MISPKKVLVVDDEMGIRCLLSEVLKKNGFDVTMAKDGQESLEQLGRERFDLVVTDIRMPGVDGIAVLKWMRQESRKEKIILMTGNPGDIGPQEMDMPEVVTLLPCEVPRGLLIT